MNFSPVDFFATQPTGGGSSLGSNLGGIGGSSAASTGLGFNVGTGQLLLGGVSTLGNLWTAWNATELAKKQFDFQKRLATANYANQVQTYNTGLEDRSRSRHAMENKSQAESDAYVASHRLNAAF